MLKIDLFTLTSKEPNSTEIRSHSFSSLDAKLKLIEFFQQYKDQYRIFRTAFSTLFLNEPAFKQSREKLKIKTEDHITVVFQKYTDKELFSWLIEHYDLKLLNEIGAFISLFGLSVKLTHDTASMDFNVPMFVESEIHSVNVNCYADTPITYEMVNSFNYLYSSREEFEEGLKDIFLEIATEHYLWIDCLIVKMDESEHVSRIFRDNCIENIASAQSFFNNFEEKGKDRLIAYANWIVESFDMATLFEEGIIEEITETKITITKKTAKFS